jgi:hypothetical protein
MSSFASRTFGTVVFQGVGACLPQAGFQFTLNAVKGSDKNGGAQRSLSRRSSRELSICGAPKLGRSRVMALLDQSPALE